MRFFLEIGTSLNVGAFFSDRAQNVLDTHNGFTMGTFRGMPSLVPKFPFLVVEIGLLKPPNLRFFSEIGTLHKVMAHFFLVGSRGYWVFQSYFLDILWGILKF